MTFSVFIPTYKRADMLSSAVAAVLQSSRQPIEIILVYRPDDDPDTRAWVEANRELSPLLRPIPIYVQGKVAAQNLGIESARGDIIVMFDDDAAVRPDWFERILPHFDNPQVAAAGGRDFVHGPGGSATLKPKTFAGVRDFWGRTEGNHHVVIGPPREVEVLKGCDWALRRSALGSLRFDERLLGIGAQAGDDYWFCINLREAGWKVILDPQAIVDHYPAYKPDYAQGSWGKTKCYEWTANQTAHNLAFRSWGQKSLYLVHSLLIGVRQCPGLYYALHSLLKRPRSLPDQITGGWAGFMRGWRMADAFTRHPPGRASKPPGTTRC